MPRDGYEDLIDSLTLPDPDDRHVLAAAIRSSAEVIVTYNLKDFPAETLAKFDIEAQHPDDFLLSLFDLAPGQVCAAIKRQRESLQPTEDSRGNTRHARKQGPDPGGRPSPGVRRSPLMNLSEPLDRSQVVGVQASGLVWACPGCMLVA